MAVRIRKNRKIIVCAAENEPMINDCYLDDNVHYVLWEMGLLKTNDGGETWFFKNLK